MYKKINLASNISAVPYVANKTFVLKKLQSILDYLKP